jgi:hypothetical protein
MRLRTSAIVAVLTLTGTMVAAPAWAAVPPNDEVANATVIRALPYTVEQDIREATKSTGDPRPKCDRGTRGQVWFKLTASADGWLVADTKGSEIRTVAAVYTGSPGALTEVACNDDTIRDDRYSQKARVYWDASAGTTYYLMVAKDFGGGGLLKVSVDHSAPPFSVDAFDIDSSGSVDNKTGVAYLHGTITCSQGPGRVYLGVELVQQVSRFYIRDFTSRRIMCDGTMQWRMKFVSETGLFTGGSAEAIGRYEWVNGNGGFVRLPATTVHLRGGGI